MILGVLLLIATGLAWTFTGVLLSLCTRQRLAPAGVIPLAMK